MFHLYLPTTMQFIVYPNFKSRQGIERAPADFLKLSYLKAIPY